MKQIIPITICFILINACCCQEVLAQEIFSNEKVKEMLMNFYESYIVENSTFPVNQKKRDSIEKAYLTANAFNQFRDVESMDYDPILKSQMVDVAMLKTMKFEKDLNENNIFYVSYTYGKDQITIKLLIVKERGKYKIDLVYKD